MIVIAELQKPCTDKERADFIVTYNHNQGLKIEEDNISIRALDYDDEEKEQQKQQKESEEKELALQTAIEELGKEMAKADLAGDEEWKADLRAEYEALIMESEE